MLWLILCLASCAPEVQPPRGLARAALDNPAFDWVKQDTSHLRLYFLANSHPASHKEELARRCETAHHDLLALLGVDRSDDVIDVFFIESRDQMDALVGVPVTGFAERDARAVFLVTNAEWRAFERHEIMHVLAHHAWGPASGAWVEEGLAQFADGMCGGYSVDDAVLSLAEHAGYVPVDTLVAHFRQLDDITAYLQAASMVGFLYHTHGREAARAVWQRGPIALPDVAGQTPAAFAESWWQWLRSTGRPVPADSLEIIRQKGCG